MKKNECTRPMPLIINCTSVSCKKQQNEFMYSSETYMNSMFESNLAATLVCHARFTSFIREEVRSARLPCLSDRVGSAMCEWYVAYS